MEVKGRENYLQTTLQRDGGTTSGIRHHFSPITRSARKKTREQT